jgi:hypothetical protein
MKQSRAFERCGTWYMYSFGMSLVHVGVSVVKVSKDVSKYVYCKAFFRHTSSSVRWGMAFLFFWCVTLYGLTEEDGTTRL